MYFAISDAEGNTVESFTDERAAERRLIELTESVLGTDEVYVLLGYTDDEEPAGEARLVEDVLARAVLIPNPVIDYLSIKVETAGGVAWSQPRPPRVSFIEPARARSPETTGVPV
jgi:hypothetical protein